MMSDAIELKDENYDLLRVERKPRQIKTRPSSFSKIKSAWTNFRLGLLNKQLEHMENSILKKNYETDSSSRLTDEAREDIIQKTAAIARVEEKILILSREKVPANYVSKRAIKLKKNMMSNLTYNTSNAYSVGIDKKEEIFGSDLVENMNAERMEEPVVGVEPVQVGGEPTDKDIAVDNILAATQNEMARSVSNIMNAQESEHPTEKDEVDVVIPELDRKQIKDAIDKEFEKVLETKNLESAAVENKETVAISPEEVEKVVNGTPEEKKDENVVSYEGIASALNAAFRDLDSQNTQERVIGTPDIDAAISSELDGIGREEVEVSNVEEGVQTPTDTVEDTDSVRTEETHEEVVPEGMEHVSYDDIRKELEEAFRRVHVSQNGSQAARIDRYDENGERRVASDLMDAEHKYEYKPMTDEEIRQAQENIEYDRYEDIYHNRGASMSDDANVNLPVNNFSVPNFNDIFRPVKSFDAGLKADSDTSVEPSVEEEKPVRDFPAIVPERSTFAPEKIIDTPQEEEIEEYTMGEEEDENLHFDYSNTTPSDLEKAVSSVNNLNEVEALKRRARELQEQQRRTKEQMEAAQREAEEAAERAAIAREEARRSYEEYQKRVERLRMYTEAVQEDCEFNVNKMEMARRAAEGDQRFAEEQRRRAEQNAQLSEEIDAIISPEAVNVRRR